MFKKTLLSVLGAALALTLISFQPAHAQSGYDGSRASSARPGELAREDGDDRRSRRDPRARRRAAPSPEQNRAAAQAVLTAAGVECQIAEAVLLGETAEGNSSYEVACTGGPGHILVSSTPPQTFNCLELAGQAENSRLRDPQADVGQQCALPANADSLPLLSTWAREAGVDCTVDKASAYGRSPAGNLVYEIGCADRDGYRIEKVDGAWKNYPCWDLSIQNISCRYTTPEETAGAWKAILANTEAAACDVQQARRVGRDAQGLIVYEVKCGAGDGYFARVDETRVAQRVHPCAAAQNIGGGCTLTPVAAATTSEQ